MKLISTWQTERLVVRPLKETDAEFILTLLNEPEFIKQIADKQVRTIDNAINYIETGPQLQYRQHDLGLMLMVRKQDDKPIGLMGLLKRDFLDDPDIGYALSQAFTGHGYAIEAAVSLMHRVAAHTALNRINAICNPTNQASLNLLDKLGFVKQGMIELPDDGQPVVLLETFVERGGGLDGGQPAK
ncbi:hypothetical protein BFR57_05335 [Idiomarina sp. MD25a]|uniref:GNAT family N-acetyltransferase n=1 Tax=Idiomarina sp. MD25a TaxID=1889913 RepID=UPI0008F8BA8C|nr:GNAT family N-acetyltransferase [Idiomarina sp. MD25a]OIM99972.1 hypothetical protein BFR57_05335 [Idiomarina sp. MD25a]